MKFLANIIYNALMALDSSKGAETILSAKTAVTYVFKLLNNAFFILLIIAIGLFTLLIDAKRLRNEGKKKDTKLAKAIGISYIAAGPILYVISKFFKGG